VGIVKFGSGGLSDRREVDAVDTDIAEVGEGVGVAQRLAQSGRGVGVDVVTGTVHRYGADGDELALEGGREFL